MEQAIAAQFGVPVGKTKVALQFNKVNGALSMVVPSLDVSTLNQEYFTYAETELDFENEVVVSKKDNTQPATADDWVVVAKDSLPKTMYEDEMDSLARDKITKEYPVVQQVNLVGKALVALDNNMQLLTEHINALGAELGVDLKPLLLEPVSGALTEMYNYIDEVKQANTLRKEYYQESDAHVYISSAEKQARLDAILEGGIHEAFGARPSQGGRVF